ncbi:VWA domain-containing protein [bacterium]|nr:VWA domain-containing protein [bacterium]
MKFDLFALSIAVGGFLAFLLLLFFIYRRKQPVATLKYSGIGHLKAAGSTWRVRFRWSLLILRLSAILLFLIAFARPQKGLEMIRTSREGIAIQMVIDRSSSMKNPLTYKGKESDRLDVVKKVLEEFLKGNDGKLRGRGNDMVGLSSFAGFVEENAPLTLDHNTLVSFAKTIRPATRIEDGTMIGDAIYYSTLRLVSVDELLQNAGEKNNDYNVKSKIIILLTDGQQTRGGKDPLEASEFAKENGIKIYTIAIVSDQNYQQQNSVFGQFFSLMNNQLDTRLLEQVAEITGGKFAKATSGESLVEIYEQIDQLEKSSFNENFTTYREIFPFFVTIGFCLLILEQILSQTLFRKIP